MDGSSAATRFREHGETYDSMRRSIRSTSFGKAKRKICERWAKEGVAERPEKLPQKMPCLDPSHEHGRDKKPQSAGTWGYPVPVKSLSNIMEPSQGETMPASFDGLCSCCGGGADTTCNSPWGHKNPLLPGAGRMPRGGRICFERHQEGVGKLYGTSFLIRKPEDEVLNHTPGPGEYALRM